MNFETIAEYCMGAFLPLMKERTELDIFQSIYSGRADAVSIARFLHELEIETRDKLVEKLDHKLMDMTNAMITPAEQLMFMLRLENAIVILDLLSRQTISRRQLVCELSTAIPDEALLWAISCLWDTTGLDHLHRVAEAFSRNEPSFLKLAER